MGCGRHIVYLPFLRQSVISLSLLPPLSLTHSGFPFPRAKIPTEAPSHFPARTDVVLSIEGTEIPFKFTGMAKKVGPTSVTLTLKDKV